MEHQAETIHLRNCHNLHHIETQHRINKRHLETAFFPHLHNARLRGWQRITQNSNTTTESTTAHWDWKRHALPVPLEAFVRAMTQH
ncbi:hypothetical protein EFU27_18805 [Vibrio cholerae]|nr:hypothetical protein [Vibrio cholerae]